MTQLIFQGAKECIEAAKLRIQEIVDDLNAMVTVECVIPQCHHRSVMGAKGFKVQGITAEFDVQIKFPDRVNPGSNKRIMKLTIHTLDL